VLPNLPYLHGCLLLALACSSLPAQKPAAPSSAEQVSAEAQPGMPLVGLLPETTAGYLRAIDMPTLCDAWDKTTLSNIRTAPSMKPFWDAQQASTEQQLLAAGVKVGLRLPDLYDMSSGEVVLAWLTYPDPKRPYAISLITEIEGRRAQADKALATLESDMRARQAKRSDVTHLGQTIRVYTMPKAPGQFKLDQIAVTLNDNRLIASDRATTVKLLLDAEDGKPATPLLINDTDYAEVWTHVGKHGENEVHWFVRPLAFARVMREVAGTERGQRVDVVNLLERQGFAAVKAAGGGVQVAEGKYDLIHHGFIYAPPASGDASRFELAAKMLNFPNTKPSPLPSWIDPDASSCLRVSWKMEEAFWAAETLVDDAFGSEIFRPTLKGIKEDVEGPQIDIANDIIAHFDDELFHVTDNINADSDRTLVAVRLTNAAVVAASVNKAMASEPDASRVEESPEHPIWKVVPEVETELEDDTFGDFFDADDVIEEDDRPAPLLEQWAITVIEDPGTGIPGGGYLIFSSHAPQLVQTVARIRQQQQEAFTEQPDVQAVLENILELGGNLRSTFRVNRTRLSWRVKYHSMRQGKLRESDSILGNLIRRATEDDNQEPRPASELSTSKLPPFAAIEDFLKPAGGFMHTEDDGWRLRGFLLKE